MRLTPPQLGLPLLSKELAEQAARRRTYIIRVVYATLLFVAGFAFYYSLIRQYGGDFSILGHGRQLFEQIVMMQFMGIYIFMPAMTCTVITTEKERSSLGLLFLTRLGPWTILLEKFLSRFVPMFMFLLLSLPLLVIAYSLGGISQTHVWSAIWFLSLTILQAGSLALLCSSFFRTTVGAFMGTYILGILMLFWLPVTNEILRLQLNQVGYLLSIDGELIPFMFLTPAIFEITSRSPATPNYLLASLPILLQTLLFLCLARYFLVRRAFLSSGNFFLKVLRWLDAFFHKLNDNRWTKGRVILSDETDLNTLTEPVAWRETTKTSLGAVRYLIRLFLLIEAPIITVGLLLIAADGSHEPIAVMYILLWIVVALIVAVKATTLIAGERAHETLDVLLATPLRSSEIVNQKFRGVTRLMTVLSIPLLTCIFLKVTIVQAGGAYRYGYQRMRPDTWILYLVCALLEVAVYLPLVAHLALFIGMRIRNQSKAIFVTLAAIVAWCALPVFFFVMLLEGFGWGPGSGVIQCLLLTSPATIIPFNEFFELNQFGSEWVAVILNFLMYSLALVLLRALCFTQLDRSLGRASGEYV